MMFSNELLMKHLFDVMSKVDNTITIADSAELLDPMTAPV